jgi:hypothetical protein
VEACTAFIQVATIHGSTYNSLSPTEPSHARTPLPPRTPQGDNDPVDVVEIGSAALKMGGVYKVKPLGIYAMIDDGELDWKVIAISVADAKADKVNNVADVER